MCATVIHMVVYDIHDGDFPRYSCMPYIRTYVLGGVPPCLFWFPLSIIVNGSATMVVQYNEGGTHYVLSFRVFNSTVRIIRSKI